MLSPGSLFSGGGSLIDVSIVATLVTADLPYFQEFPAGGRRVGRPHHQREAYLRQNPRDDYTT